MTQLFVSYSRVNIEFVRQLVQDLQESYSDIRFWFNKGSQKLLGRDERAEEIRKAIADSEIFIYVLSDESLRSDSCQAEFREALRLQKRIITIQASDHKNLDKSTKPYSQMRYDMEAALALLNPSLEAALTEQTAIPKSRQDEYLTVLAAVLLLIALIAIGLLNLRYMHLVSSSRTPFPNDLGQVSLVSLEQRSTPIATVIPATATPVPMNPAAIQAIEMAYAGVSSNAEWENLYPNGFVQEFEGIAMLLVPVGCFTIGSEQGLDDEKNGNELCFSKPFWIDQTEVRQSDFERLNGEAGRNSNFPAENHPVERINWFEAQEFCEKRGARLPGEDEWEYAARGVDGLLYPWGNAFDINKVAYGNNSAGQTVDVGTLPGGASWIGAYDMAGNVWEWTASLYHPYPYRAGDGREVIHETAEEIYPVLRGGAWFYMDEYARASFRVRDNPYERYNRFGFRCLREID